MGFNVVAQRFLSELLLKHGINPRGVGLVSGARILGFDGDSESGALAWLRDEWRRGSRHVVDREMMNQIRGRGRPRGW